MADPKKEEDIKTEEIDTNEEPLSPESATGNYQIATNLLQEMLDGKKNAASAAQRLVKKISDTAPMKKPKSA